MGEKAIESYLEELPPEPKTPVAKAHMYVAFSALAVDPVSRAAFKAFFIAATRYCAKSLDNEPSSSESDPVKLSPDSDPLDIEQSGSEN